MEVKSLHRGDCVRLRSGVVVDVAHLIEENKRLRAENERLRYRGDGPLVKEDGTRVTRFACVDGPDFNGYEVDFDEAMSRGRMYMYFERRAYDETCSLLKK